MLVIAFVLLVVAGCIFAFEFAKNNYTPYSMLAFALQAFGLACWLFWASDHLHHVLEG